MSSGRAAAVEAEVVRCGGDASKIDTDRFALEVDPVITGFEDGWATITAGIYYLIDIETGDGAVWEWPS